MNTIRLRLKIQSASVYWMPNGFWVNAFGELMIALNEGERIQCADVVDGSIKVCGESYKIHAMNLQSNISINNRITRKTNWLCSEYRLPHAHPKPFAHVWNDSRHSWAQHEIYSHTCSRVHPKYSPHPVTHKTFWTFQIITEHKRVKFFVRTECVRRT